MNIVCKNPPSSTIPPIPSQKIWNKLNLEEKQRKFPADEMKVNNIRELSNETLKNLSPKKREFPKHEITT